MRRFSGYALLAAVLAIGLAVASAAQAQASGQAPQGQRMGPRGGGMGGAMAALKLTDDQHQAMQKLMETFRTNNESLMQTLRTAQDAYRTALYGTDPTGANDKFDAVVAAQDSLLRARLALQVQFSQLLTTEQRQIALTNHIDLPPMGPMGPGRMRGPGK